MRQAPESMLVMVLLDHAGNGVTEVMLAMAQSRCQVMLEMALPRRLCHGTMSLPSHAGNGATEVTLAVA
jgi:hypothetical protein